MPRTREQWNTEISSYALAAGLSNSATANWKLWRDMIVTLIMIFEGILTTFTDDVDTTLSNKQPGTLRWYAAIAKQWQKGYNLTVAEGLVLYATIDATAQIVTQASVRESEGNVIIIKVAKNGTVPNSLVQLDAQELFDFKEYMIARAIPGVLMNIYSYNADVLQYTLHLHYDPLYDPNALQAAVTNALNAFRDNFPFDSILYYHQFISALIQVPGVVNVAPNSTLSLTLQNGSTVNNFTTQQEMPAGYFVYHNNSTITLQAAI